MKLSISRETLFRVLKHASAVVERRTTIAILGNVRLAARDNKLEMTGTDNDLTVQGVSEAFVDSDGVTTVGALKFFEIVSKIPEGVMVSLEVVDGGSRLAVTAGKAKFSLATLGAEAFPDMTRVNDGVTFSLQSAALKKLLDKVSFAASSDETRAYLTGVYLHEIEENGNPLLRAVATDGHRLAKADITLPDAAHGMAGVILPKKCVAELKKLSELGKDVTLTVADTKIQAECGDITLTSKVIDASFPDYSRVIPKDASDVLTVARKSLLQAVERVSILSHEKTRSVRLKVDGGLVQLSANNPDQENASEEVKADYTGQPLEVGFNARYLSEIGAQIEADDVVMHCKDSSSPVMLKDPADAGSLFVVMPMRV